MIIAKKDEIKGMFEKNLKLLTPWLRESVLTIDEDELWNKVEVTYNEEGFPVCRYHREHSSFQITSEHPVQEAQKWSETFSIHGAGAIFLYGTGFGYPLFEIFAKKESHTLVVVFEQDICLFKAMLYYFDFEEIINTRKIAFFPGDSTHFSNAFEQLFYSVHFMGSSFPTVACTYAAQRNFKAQYIEIHKYIFTQLALLVFHIGNDHQDNLIGFLNLLGNVKEMLKDPYLSCLKDTYKDVPAFIIANGPSLDQNIQQLKKIQGRGLIISVESAIKPLMKNEIKPDILTIIERTKATYTCHFENIHYPKDIALFCLALVDKHVFPSFQGEKIPIYRASEAINQWMNKYLGDGSALNAGANVSHLAMELAAYLGANPIVFVGQDYAFGPNGMTHSKDSIYYEERGARTREIIHSRPVVYVEGNNGEMIPSYQLWVDFRHGLERKIAMHPDKIFFNATEGGAKIEGTKCARLNAVIDEYCTSPLPHRVNEVIFDHRKNISMEDRKKRLEEYIESVNQYAESFRKLAQEAITGRMECKKMINLSREKDYAKFHDLLKKTYQKNNSIFNDFIMDYLHRCFSQQVLFSGYYLINRLGPIDSPEKVSEIFKIQYNFFSQLNAVCQSVSVHLENSVDLLQIMQKDFENEEAKG